MSDVLDDPRVDRALGAPVADGAAPLRAEPVERHEGRLARVARYLSAQRAEVHARLVLAQVLVRLIPFNSFALVRGMIYRAAGFRIGRRVRIAGPLTLWGTGALGDRLHVGERTFINSPAHIELNAPVRIGANCAIGHHLVVITTNHELGPSSKRAGEIYHDGVTIGDGAWIGARVTILPGVTIGPGAFIVAGTIVTRSVPANARVAGARGKVIDVLDDAAPPPRRGRAGPRP